MFAARLRAYEPAGAAAGFLPTPAAASIAAPHNDRGALTLTYNTLASGGALVERALGSGLEVALEVQDRSGAWVEPRGCRFLAIKRNRDRKDQSGTVTLTLPSYGWLLGVARILTGPFYGPEHKQAGKRGFEGKTAGFILLTLLAENAVLDGVPLTPVFDAVNDSAGNPWPVLENIAFDEGTTLATVLDTLVQAGALDWRTQARGLYAWGADSPVLSPDLSGPDGVNVDLAWLVNAPEEETLEGMVGRLLVATDAGGRVQVTEPSTPSPWGVWQGYLQIGSVADESAAVTVGQAELEHTGRPRGQYTRDFTVTDETPWPLVDFESGAWITAPGAGGAPEKLRTQDINLTMASDGSWSGSLVLNDRLLDADLRRARNLAALTTGGQVSPSGPPANTDPEASRVPSTPTGLDAVAGLYFDAGIPRGVVTASWDAVTTATDDGALTVATYELQWRVTPASTGVPGDWQTTVTPELSADIPALTPGDSVTVRVRAVGARTVNPSAWSGTVTVPITGDVTAPTAPSTPTIASRLGTVTVTWDGLTNVGGPMEDDFHHVEVALDDTVTPTTVVGRLTAAGSLPVENQPLGEMRTARLRAVDTSGNEGAWSDPSDPILVQGVTGPDLEAESVTTNALQAGVVTGDKLAGVLALISRIVSPAETGQRVEIGQEGIQLYTADEDRWVNLPTDPEQDPEFRGRIEAEGLTVRQGAQFFSTLNEFAKDSVISLAEQVAAPITSPNVSSFWEWFATTRTPVTGALGTFALDPSAVVHASWNPGLSCYHLLQRVSGGGARVWYYNPNGTLVTSGGNPLVWDLPASWHVTSVMVGADGEFRIMYSWNDKWWIWDYSRGSTAALAQREYLPGNTLREPMLTMDGNNIWVAESFAAGPRFRRVTTNTTPVTVAEEIVSSGAPSGSASPYVFYRGTLDLGVPKFVVSYLGTSSMRVYSSTGAYEAANSWEPPVSKSGGFWDPTSSRWRTFGQDGRLYRHSSLTWTDPSLDTWHLAQTFYDGQVTGGLHETKIGAVRTFNPKKRSWVRIQPVPVPYAGGTDDPNQWRLYGKTGTAPGVDGAGLVLQESGAYNVLVRDRSTLLTTSGTAPPTTSNFPGASPARLLSQRTMPGDATRRILDVRGDGSGWWGSLQVDGAGNVTDSRNASQAMVLIGGVTATACTVWRRGDMAGVMMVFNKPLEVATNTTIFMLPSIYRPIQEAPIAMDLNSGNPVRIFGRALPTGELVLNWYGTDTNGVVRGTGTWITAN
ncbi:hypothetical protein ACFQHV_00950 [Promicromonospora thailandica]|uniref:Fibronectin type-III domain-containing protein n=1 Tax=Promicromonospora thailandica TaxID=765201 RepID=A0A9X2JWW8_9MICO|nr:hypothetical protein [Promicromonospora thailandica]MCP2265578.1 hypothetical protein [Promicromonospora thailandica]BFF17141.1 hypothetical protein GCM10025730_06620 [Promicromonospora thailandica]